jgi:hypothetical protein
MAERSQIHKIFCFLGLLFAESRNDPANLTCGTPGKVVNGRAQSAPENEKSDLSGRLEN